MNTHDEHIWAALVLGWHLMGGMIGAIAVAVVFGRRRTAVALFRGAMEVGVLMTLAIVMLDMKSPVTSSVTLASPAFAVVAVLLAVLPSVVLATRIAMSGRWGIFEEAAPAAAPPPSPQRVQRTEPQSTFSTHHPE